jgi:hypothetical protein
MTFSTIIHAVYTKVNHNTRDSIGIPTSVRLDTVTGGIAYASDFMVVEGKVVGDRVCNHYSHSTAEAHS